MFSHGGHYVVTRAHLLALVLIAVLTYVNVVGLRWGALLQNVSTWTKFLAPWRRFVLSGIRDRQRTLVELQRPMGFGLTMGLGPGQLISAMGVGLDRRFLGL